MSENVSKRPIDQSSDQPWFAAGDIVYVSASFFLTIMQWLPAKWRIWVIDKISALLGSILYTMNVHVTRMVRENMYATLGRDRSSDAVAADVRQLLSLIVWNALVINSLPVLPKEQIADLVPIEGMSCLDSCMDSSGDRRPLLIWGFHFGIQPLIVAAVLHARGYPIHAVTHVRQMPAAASAFQRRYLQRLERIGNQFSVIDPREGVQRKMLDVLKNGECLYVTPDYMMRSDEPQFRSPFTVSVDYLGRKAFLQTGALRLAKRLNARVATVFSTWRGVAPHSRRSSGRQLRVEPFVLPTSGFKPVELQHDLEACMRRLEGYVLAQPDFWWDLKRDDLTERLIAVAQDGTDQGKAEQEG